MKTILPKLMPFILLGIGIVAFVFGLILLAYLLVFGALVGLLLYAVAWVKERFFPSKTLSLREKSNRTFDQDDFR